jgi:hypothetical protein
MASFATPFSPSSELTSIGVGKESTFGSAASPTAYLICDETTFTPTSELLERPGARQRIGRTASVAGMFTGKGTLSCEADPDNIEAILCFGMGLDALGDSGFGNAGRVNYQAAITNPGTNGSVSTTLAAQVKQGSNIAQLTSATGVSAGSLLTVDSTGFTEAIQVLAKNSPNIAARFLRGHSAGVNVISSPVTNAHLRVLQIASPRPSFTSTVYRVTDLIEYVGCKVSSLSISPSEKAILTVKAQLEYQNELGQGGYSPYDPSPSWPSAPTITYSTLDPFRFQDPGNYGNISGSASSATIMGWQVDVNNGVVADYPNFNNGRLRSFYPEQQTKVSGTLSLGFETEDAVRQFWGNALAQSPQTVLAPITLAFQFQQPWYINASYQYTLIIAMGLCKISTVGIPIKNGDYLKQSVKFEAYETTNGAQDDILIFLFNTNNSASNSGGF